MSTYGASNICKNIYGASDICMNSYGASDICMTIYGASNMCINSYGASNICMNILRPVSTYSIHDSISWISTPALRQKPRIVQTYTVAQN